MSRTDVELRMFSRQRCFSDNRRHNWNIENHVARQRHKPTYCIVHVISS